MQKAVLILLASAVFYSIGAENCEAQLFSGRLRHEITHSKSAVAPPVWVQPAGHIGTYVPQDYNAAPVFPVEDYYTPRRPKLARILDGPMTHKYRNPAEVDARYIGGFHQSHFQNIGIPSGDIGLRGNAYNWRTWP